jgi:hypothetical protein
MDKMMLYTIMNIAHVFMATTDSMDSKWEWQVGRVSGVSMVLKFCWNDWSLAEQETFCRFFFAS